MRVTLGWCAAILIVVSVVACSESGSDPVEMDTDAAASSNGGADVGVDSSNPMLDGSNDITNMACMDAASAYNRLVSNAVSCQVDDQCQVLRGPCQAGLGTCHEVVNISVAQDDLDMLGVTFEAEGCSDRSCTCEPAPPARCEDGACVLGRYCDATHNIGDVWVADDGCSVCSCTFDGVNCRDDACDPCADAELPECPRTCPAGFEGQACHPGAVCGNMMGQQCTCTDARWQCTFLEPSVEGCDTLCVPGEPPTCEALDDEYEALLQSYSACETNDDCHTLQGSCSVGLGACHEPVGTSLPQESLSALSSFYFQGRCSEEVCTCDPAPPTVCEEGQCVLGRFCGEYDLGESWSAGDECNMCTCTLGGAVCTENVCGDPCEGAELPECPETCPEGSTEGQPCDTPDATCGDDMGLACTCTNTTWSCETLDPPVEGCATYCTPPEEDPCTRVMSDYGVLIEDSKVCGSDSECQWLFGQCGLGLGGCYEAVNTSIAQVDLGALGAAFLQNRCEGERCGSGVCGQEPLVRCVESRCTEVEYCAGRELGEVWENGCTVCTCTTEGALCDNSNCPTACDMIEDEYAELVSDAQTCEEDLDCQILRGHCGVGDCFAYVNLSIEQSQLDELNLRYREEGCVDLLCHCTLPFTVECANGRCKNRAE